MPSFPDPLDNSVREEQKPVSSDTTKRDLDVNSSKSSNVEELSEKESTSVKTETSTSVNTGAASRVRTLLLTSTDDFIFKISWLIVLLLFVLGLFSLGLTSYYLFLAYDTKAKIMAKASIMILQSMSDSEIFALTEQCSKLPWCRSQFDDKFWQILSKLKDLKN